MKKYVLIAATACVALAACTKNEVRPVNVDQEITFQAVVNKASTKAGTFENDAKYPTDRPFGTVAYLESSGNQKYFGPEEVSYNSTKHYWSTATAYYWPKNDALTFMSYSPYKYQESGSTDVQVGVAHAYNKLTIDNYNVAAHQETDLMVADIQKGQKANTTQDGGTWQKGVPTVFHHKLSQIVAINFQTVDTQAPNDKKDYDNGHDGSSEHPYAAGDQQFFINEVSLKNTCFKGSYSYVYDDPSSPATTTEGWTKDDFSTESSTLWFIEPSGDPNTNGKIIRGEINPQRTSDSGSPVTNNYILILPQTFDAYTSKEAAPHIYIKYTVRTYYAANGYSDEVIEEFVPIYDIHPTWAMNKKITYNFNLTKQRIYWDPQVVDWGSESHTVEI